MNSKYQIIKHKITLFIIALMFLFASFMIVFIHIKFTYNNTNIIKIYADVKNIEYYEYGTIKKRKFANVVYSFNYSNENIILTNSYMKELDTNFNINSKVMILYDIETNTIINEPNKYTLILAFIFIVFAVMIIIFALKLKQNNIYVSPKLNK
ncbi:hypothetical protein [uncultured Brachyspira sp.]|uniref:hypothetical protein n=1 Tax=uncultured Brachyspira sp. TaxID=221953 RepID=UPI002629E17A|nr:hypothetical protein [uncultured Brachyspira sp.]